MQGFEPLTLGYLTKKKKQSSNYTANILICLSPYKMLGKVCDDKRCLQHKTISGVQYEG